MAKSKKQKPYKTSKKEKVGFKNWLNNNKIYFETIMALSLTIMGVLISVVSLSFQKKAILIEEQLHMPVFNISQTPYYEEHTIDGIIYPAGMEVNIINNGGNISNGYLSADAKIEIIVKDKEYNSKGNVVVENTQKYMKGHSYYDARTKSFTLQKDFDLRRLELQSYLYNKLQDEYKDYDFAVLISDYLNIQYYDFKNQYHNEWYGINGGDLLNNSPIESKQIKSLEVNTMTNEEVYLEIKKMIDTLLETDK